MPHAVVARTYLNEALAEIGRAVLDAHDIPSYVRTADAAGLLRTIVGVQLVVRPEDLARARALLDIPEHAEEAEDGDAS